MIWTLVSSSYFIMNWTSQRWRNRFRLRLTARPSSYTEETAETNRLPDCLNGRFLPHLLSKGAFFFVEPPYGYLAVGLNRCIVRGIYNIQIEEEEGYEPSVLSAFSMEIELQDCSLTDVVLEYRGTPQFHLQNQKIPLTIEETDGILSITADLDRVSPIVTDLGNNLIFRGVITYKGEEYSFSSRI